MAARNSQPSKTEILAFLRDCGFDPRNQAEMRSLAVVTRPDFCEDRAIELINEAQLSLTTDNFKHYDQCLVRAIRLLVLARMERKRLRVDCEINTQAEALEKSPEAAQILEDIKKLGPKTDR